MSNDCEKINRKEKLDPMADRSKAQQKIIIFTLRVSADQAPDLPKV